MPISVIPISDISPAEWDGLVHGSPDGWVFALHSWQQLVLDVKPWGFEEHGFGLIDDGQLVAVCPLHYRPSTRCMASSGWGGTGPVLAGKLPIDDRQRLLAIALDTCVDMSDRASAERLDMSCSPVTATSLGAKWGVNPIGLGKLADTSLLSQVIALDADEEQLWLGLSKTARNLVRRAIKNGYRAETVEWIASANQYYEVHTETYTRTGATPHPKEYFEAIANRISPSGNSRLLAALTADGEPVAYHNTAQFGVGAYYHTGCSRSIAQNDGVGYLLMWEAIKQAKRHGALWFDCGLIFPAAADTKQHGLTLFKTRFGGEPHRAFRAELVREKSASEPSTGAPDSAYVTGWNRQRLRRAVRRLLTGRRQ